MTSYLAIALNSSLTGSCVEAHESSHFHNSLMKFYLSQCIIFAAVIHYLKNRKVRSAEESSENLQQMLQEIQELLDQVQTIPEQLQSVQPAQDLAQPARADLDLVESSKSTHSRSRRSRPSSNKVISKE
jgi:hypothetical protein